MMGSETEQASQVSGTALLFRRLFSLEALPIIIATCLLFIFFGLKEPRFWQSLNLINVLRNSAYLIIIASGQMLVLITGGFDLSVGAVVGLSSIVTALTMAGAAELAPGHVGLIVASGVVAALLAGSLVGLCNGLCVALLKVNPFIVTLGTMSIATGLTFYVTAGRPIYGMPEAFIFGFGRIRWLGLPASIYLTAAVMLALWLVLNWTRLGRYLYAIGGNPHAAHVSGIPINLCTTVAYLYCGMLAALAGVLLTAKVGSGEGTMGGNYMLESIAAAVLGGVSLGGGVGRVEFVILGGFFLTMVTNGMNLMWVDSRYQTIVVGALLILAVALDRIRRQKA